MKFFSETGIAPKSWVSEDLAYVTSHTGIHIVIDRRVMAEERVSESVEPSSGDNAQTGVQPQEGQQGQRQQGSFLQTFIWRLVVFWFISNLLRRSFGPKSDGIPSKNMFDKSQLMVGERQALGGVFIDFFRLQDMHVFLSERKHFSDFDNQSALFWFVEDLEYGSWSDGEKGDGTRTYSRDIPISQVRCLASRFNCAISKVTVSFSRKYRITGLCMFTCFSQSLVCLLTRQMSRMIDLL